MKTRAILFLMTSFFMLKQGMSQNEPDTTLSFTHEEAIDTIFGALDRSKILSGILIDRAPSIVQKDMMDGKY